MALRKIALEGEACLSKVCRPVTDFNSRLHTLLDAVNTGVLDATAGLLDAKTLAAAALTVAALRSKAQKGWAVPGAMTLLWWASRLFGAQGDE